MLRTLLSSQLNSLIRQQLRRTLEADKPRNLALVDALPRGRGVLFLAKADSAAKVLSCALYEAHQLSPMLHAPSLLALLAGEERDARDAINELPEPILDDLLTLNEAHAALRHLLSAVGAPEQGENGWRELCRLIAIARNAGCVDEVHFYPLEQLDRLIADLATQAMGVPALVRLMSWTSPQHPLNQRTRAKALAGATPGAKSTAKLIDQLKSSPPSE